MQLSSEVHIPDGLLAANALLAENSHQGFATSKNTLHQGFVFAISSTAIDFQLRCSEIVSGTVAAPNKPCSVSQRAQLFGNGVLNLALAAGKFGGAAGVEIGSSGIGTALALYGVYSGAGNLTTGLIQTVGAFTSNPAQFQQAASVSSVAGSGAGLTTLFATGGNLTAASNAARFENFGLFGFKLGLGNSFNPLSATGTAVNAAKQVGVPIGCH